jgi:hypothetical protein
VSLRSVVQSVEAASGCGVASDRSALPRCAQTPVRRAEKALVKFACSVCLKEELGQCRSVIDWVRGRREERFTAFPVGFAFTPGVEGLGDKVSHIILLRRKDDGPEPYLWLIIQFRNFRFQVAVPLCPADVGMTNPRLEHFQSLFPPDRPRGATTFTWLDWSGTESGRPGRWPITGNRRLRSRGRIARDYSPDRLSKPPIPNATAGSTRRCRWDRSERHNGFRLVVLAHCNPNAASFQELPSVMIRPRSSRMP